MSIILSLLVLMMPLDVPPTAIWLGKGVDPVKGKKIKPGDQVQIGGLSFEFMEDEDHWID